MQKYRRSFVAVVAAICAVFVTASAATALGGTSTPSAPSAYILVDHDTGNVLSSSNARTPLPPASVTKLMTALVVVSKLDSTSPIVISEHAASMPAMKLGLGVGERWNRDQLLHALLMVSANDAAVALAEATSGDLTKFSVARTEAAQQLGLQDRPVFNDPAGLDDGEFSNQGGDQVSARDLAIIARAALNDPTISAIAATRKHSFFGGDGEGHTLTNHNKMLTQYAGTIGLKPGYTSKAKNTMIAAAKRDGRTMIAVVLGADHPYTLTSQLLDQGFATPVAAEPTIDRLALAQTTSAQTMAQVPTDILPTISESTVAWWARPAGAMFILAFIAYAVRARYLAVNVRLRSLD